jgi:hypothetical protein
MSNIIPAITRGYTPQERIEECGKGDKRDQVFCKRGRKVFWRH